MIRVIVDRLERTTKSATLLPPTLALLDDEDEMSLLVIARFFPLFCAKKEKRKAFAQSSISTFFADWSARVCILPEGMIGRKHRTNI